MRLFHQPNVLPACTGPGSSPAWSAVAGAGPKVAASSSAAAATAVRRARMRAMALDRTSHLFVGLGIAAEQPAVGAAQRGDRRHLVVGELEAEDIEVDALPLGRLGLRDG